MELYAKVRHAVRIEGLSERAEAAGKDHCFHAADRFFVRYRRMFSNGGRGTLEGASSMRL